jgi:hypothetical protein
MQRYKKPSFLVLAITIVVAMVMMTTMLGQTQNNQTSPNQDNLKTVAEDFYTVTDYNNPGPSDPQKSALRKARAKRYNMRAQKNDDPKRFMITEKTESSFGTPPFDAPVEPALPVSSSDAVVVGEVKEGQAYLSEDKTSVNSEFVITVSDVLKNNSSASLVAGAVIDTVRSGGSVRFTSGKLIRFGMLGRPFPRVGRRYLFFLKYNNEGQDFTILTAYELRGGKVTPIDGKDKDGRAMSRYPDYQKYENTEETSFLNEVRQAIANGSEEGR